VSSYHPYLGRDWRQIRVCVCVRIRDCSLWAACACVISSLYVGHFSSHTHACVDRQMCVVWVHPFSQPACRLRQVRSLALSLCDAVGDEERTNEWAACLAASGDPSDWREKQSQSMGLRERGREGVWLQPTHCMPWRRASLTVWIRGWCGCSMVWCDVAVSQSVSEPDGLFWLACGEARTDRQR